MKGQHGKMMGCFRTKETSKECRIVLLDQTEITRDIQSSTLGIHLLEAVCQHLKLSRTTYFGLRYINDSLQPRWLHLDKSIAKQLKGVEIPTLYFCVKFYATDPCKITDEAIRYQFCLQVRRDITDGRLPLDANLANQLSAYVIQAELGDYVCADGGSSGDGGATAAGAAGRAPGRGYHADLHLRPDDLSGQWSTAQLHQTLTGMPPAAAEFELLQRIRWLELYGVDLHPIAGRHPMDSFLGLAPSGLLIIRGKHKIDAYFWPRIVKLYSKKNNFMLRVRDKESRERTLGFETASRAACRELLKSAQQQRQFFQRALQQSPMPALPSSGRPEKQRSSRRQRGRRGGSDAAATEEETDTALQCRTSVSVPRPVSSASDLYLATGAELHASDPKLTDSPRSQRSALFNTNTLKKSRSKTSVDSQSSVDSRTLRRRRHRRESSVVSGTSEASASAAESGANRSVKGRRLESGSDSERSLSHRRHRGRRRRHQYQEAAAGDGPQPEPLRRSLRQRPSGYLNSGAETEAELTYKPKRRSKKHSRSRSRSKSPEWARARHLPPELRRHLQFGLVEPGDSGANADLAFTNVTTAGPAPRIKFATKRNQKTGSNNGDNSSTSLLPSTAPASATAVPTAATIPAVPEPLPSRPEPLPSRPESLLSRSEPLSTRDPGPTREDPLPPSARYPPAQRPLPPLPTSDTPRPTPETSLYTNPLSMGGRQMAAHAQLAPRGGCVRNYGLTATYSPFDRLSLPAAGSTALTIEPTMYQEHSRSPLPTPGGVYGGMMRPLHAHDTSDSGFGNDSPVQSRNDFADSVDNIDPSHQSVAQLSASRQDIVPLGTVVGGEADRAASPFARAVRNVATAI